MEQIIIEMVNKFGYIGIALLIFIESVFPPIPSELILTFGGFMTTSTSMSIIGVIFWSTIGAVLGAIVLYYIGKIFNKERLKKFTHTRLGRFIRLKEKDIEMADRWFDTKGAKTVLFGRCVPIVRSLISIPAGMSDMPLAKFLIYTTVGSTVWNIVLVNLGAAAGDNWKEIVRFFDKYSDIVLVILIIIAIAFVYYYFAHYTKKDNVKDKKKTKKKK